MARIAAESLIERLAEWGVDTVFGLPGDGINGIMEGLRRHRDRVRFVLVHHEEAAAFMATGYAKATGRIGVCLATSGPGGIHLLNGLYDAKLDHAPVLAITGMQETAVLGTGYQQEVHLDKLFADVAEYNMMISNPAQLPSLVDLAIRTAYARRGVAHLTLPNDIQVADAGADPYKTVAPVRTPETAPLYLRPSGLPRQEDLEWAAEVLNNAERPAMLVGQGALHARQEVLAVAEALGAPVVKTLPGKAVVPDDSPYTTGGIGLLGTKPSEELMEEADVLFMVGTNFPYSKFLPEPGKARVVQFEAEPTRAGARVPTDVPVVCDAQEGLRELLPLLTRRNGNGHLAKYQKMMAKWRSDMDALENPDRDPIAPQYAMSVIDDLAADDAILTCDSGTIATWAARHWTIRGDRQFYLSGTLATMAPGLPYAIAMQHAFPGRQVIAYVGDGGFAMLMAEFLTAAQHRLPVKVVINNNNSLGQILWEQMVLGYPEHGVRFAQPEADYSVWARACGGFGAKVTKAGDVAPAIRQALAHDGPALVDVDVNPNEPPMPGKVSYEQAKSFAQAFL
ncbi:MAG: pyruvate oxidase, partial [Nonomuraea sp.]|nr:pyruvate oxidase [Nonomuraea sp.]